MKVEIKNRESGAVLYSTEISAEIAGMTYAARLGFVAKKAVKERADLRGADLPGADLRGAHLPGADLRGAYLRDAYLQGAYLQDAYLQGAYLRDAYLQGADLRDAHLQGADLRGAHLQGADLRGVKNLEEATGFRLAIAQTRILPDEGSVVGWKKCNNNVIVKLLIPAGARRSHAFGRKCRAEFADVLEVFGAHEGITDTHGPRTVYRVGERVTPTSFDPYWMEECAAGIHFFITREEAEAYL